MERLFLFIEGMCKDYNIDDSHDVTHSKDCMNFAQLIMDDDCSPEEQRMIQYATALHDCVDKKYTDAFASEKVSEFLHSEGWSTADIQALLDIINTISYSYLNSRAVDGIPVFPNHGSWNRVYHIVRQSDLLCSYRVERCYKYQKRIDPTISEDDCWSKVLFFFQNRVFLYCEKGWITLPKAVELTEPLIATAQRILVEHNNLVT